MKIIIGLGNPGKKYENTRHNIGFKVIDYLSGTKNIKLNKIKFKGLYGTGEIGGEKVILLKPQTFMNLSGDSVAEILSFYKLTPNDIIVIYDDISLPLGKMRIRPKGSAGGHNGIKDIILKLGSDEFSRIKMGVGENDRDLKDFVLGEFTKDEIEPMFSLVKQADQAILDIITKGVDFAMNKYN